MFCKKCGAQIDEDSVFCPTCGANQTGISTAKETDEKMNGKQENSQAVYSEQRKAQDKKQKKKRKIIFIPAIAIMLVAAFAIVGYATSFFGLFPALHAKAPIGLILKSFYAMKDLSGAEFDLSVGSREASGYFVLGEDLKDSVLDLHITENDRSAGVAVNQGNYGVRSLDNDAYGYESGIDEYIVILFPDKAFLPEGYENPLLSEDYEKLLRYGKSRIDNAENANEKRNDQFELDTWKANAVVINDLVKNNALNTPQIQKIIEKIFEEETDHALKISDQAKKEAGKFITEFVFTECERESVYSKFIYDFNRSKSGKLNRYSFSLDISNFTVAFLEYFRDRLIDFPALEKSLDNYIKSVNSDNFFNTKGFIDYTLREIRNHLEEAPKINDMYVSMEMDKRNFFHSFEMRWVDQNYGMHFSMGLQMKNHNKVKPDTDSIDAFLDEAEKYVETQSAYNQYLESKVEKINHQPDQTDCKTTEKKFFDFDSDGVLDLYYQIQYEEKTMGLTCMREGLCTIADGKVVELFAEDEGGYSGYGGDACISTAYSRDLSKHVLCVAGHAYEGAKVLYHNYYSMENGNLTPLDKLLYYESPEDAYVKVDGKKVDEETFFKTADKYAEPTDRTYIFTEHRWKPLRTEMEENGFQLGISRTADSNVLSTSDAADPGAAAVNIDDYAGQWHIDGQQYDREYHAYEKNLSIVRNGEDSLFFQLFYFRSGSISSAVALDGNKADFTYEDGQYTVIGTLTFHEDSITVEIKNSNASYMPVETMIFNSRDAYDDGFCPRCGREIMYGNACDCTWCDKCKAWMGGHGHAEGE